MSDALGEITLSGSAALVRDSRCETTPPVILRPFAACYGDISLRGDAYVTKMEIYALARDETAVKEVFVECSVANTIFVCGFPSPLPISQ